MNPEPNWPAQDVKTITPSDTTDLTTPFRGLMVGTAGDVKIKTLNDTVIVLKNVVAGIVHPIGAKRVYTTGTTAVNIFGIY